VDMGGGARGPCGLQRHQANPKLCLLHPLSPRHLLSRHGIVFDCARLLNGSILRVFCSICGVISRTIVRPTTTRLDRSVMETRIFRPSVSSAICKYCRRLDPVGQEPQLWNYPPGVLFDHHFSVSALLQCSHREPQPPIWRAISNV
jgi:hypothetical protein